MMRALWIAPIVFSLPGAALAQSRTAPAVSRPAAMESYGSDAGGRVRSTASEWMIDPRFTTEVGAELRFLTSRVGLADEPLRFTDVGLAGLSVRHAFGARAEIAAGVDLLAKHPTWLDEPVLQSLHAAARVALASHWVLWARAAGSPLLGGLGRGGQASGGLEARSRIHETIAFQGTLGGAYTPLLLEGGDRAWLAELAATGQALVRTPGGEAALWLGADYRIPLAHRDAPALVLDPQVRLGFTAGCVLGWIDRWDLYAAVGVIDRGEADAPGTTLPILDGGFDQTQVVFGAVRRWERDEVPGTAGSLAY
jgi:hypothetical protein